MMKMIAQTTQVKVTQLRTPRASTIPPTSNSTTPTANGRTDTPELSHQDLNEHEESCHDEEIAEGNREDELEPRVSST